ncbi:hypothetical protein N7520_005441 [Penicillium odoratum]|uniref:uncharacterized protein n=1 Tax=Penicillium odoratum TaxID=1167516 RepID=UPI002547F818|nr:uncharacterized protein N7520_005441 [Penicillium odoratum]KAJ5765882.1 hypothetical protein N7520_005441 [Penicillium odoratum]
MSIVEEFPVGAVTGAETMFPLASQTPSYSGEHVTYICPQQDQVCKHHKHRTAFLVSDSVEVYGVGPKPYHGSTVDYEL